MHNRYFRRRWLLPALLALPLAARAQTGVTIGATTAPDASAALDIVSSSKGLLLPRLTAAARLGIANPAAGLLVYQTNAPTSGVGSGTTPGFYYNAGTATAARWQRLTDNNGVSYDPATGLQVGPTTPTTTTLSPYNALGGNESPFNGSNNSRRVASYIPASVLLGAGVNPNLLLTALGVTVTTKASTAPFTNFTLQLANAPSNPVGSTTDGGLVMTTVYTGTISTVGGLNTIPFTTPFKWDGVSGLYVQSCFVNTAAVGADVI
ncbi:hypothetical protein Q5H93_20600 [Hymenobacter sp. ASUV-10]|uniref:DUF4394 domain-containing protein n=1 Tax=Hymenobacter aranciens TaxID=3063996 RepID=A0ABT9BFW5_9BACT|nr:hypothetical protein [Hymenobacter sp. ASUV-10]MDO7877158.1 hypothetical protein [Hymenobacter sp. ASUV-10]